MPGHGFFTPVDVRRLLQGWIISDMTLDDVRFRCALSPKGPCESHCAAGLERTGQLVRDCHWMPLLEVKTVAFLIFVLGILAV